MLWPWTKAPGKKRYDVRLGDGAVAVKVRDDLLRPADDAWGDEPKGPGELDFATLALVHANLGRVRLKGGGSREPDQKAALKKALADALAQKGTTIIIIDKFLSHVLKRLICSCGSCHSG